MVTLQFYHKTRQSRLGLIFLLIAFLLIPSMASSQALDQALALFKQHCSSCHGVERYGGTAPPLLPEFLGRKKDPQLHAIISKGLPSTQMVGFANLLTSEQITKLVGLVRTPVPVVKWEIENIQASRKLVNADKPAAAKIFDRENTILVVERGSGSIAVFDGNSMRQMDKFQVGQIHGGPKFDQTYQNVYAITRDGTLVCYDLEKQQLKATLKVAVNTRNIAISPDAEFVVSANQMPQNVVILDKTLNPLKIFPLEGTPSAVYYLSGEQKFLLTLKNAPVLLYIDYKSGFKITRVQLPEPFEDFMFVPGKKQIIASLRQGKQILLYDLEQQKVLKSLQTKALPHLFSAAFFQQNDILYAALNHIGLPQLSIINMEEFKTVRQIPLKGSGYFVRTHPGTRFIWVDTNTEEVQLVDKTTLTLFSSGLIPHPGKKAMHIEFTADGKQALVSVWHKQGAVVVYNSENLTETQRLPFNMPIGKYNAYNKTRSL